MEVMPIPCPHFKITIVKRSQGQSAVAGAAYQSGERLFSEYDQKTKFYNKKKELVHAEVMLPSHAPPGYADRATLWNAVEAVENQWNSQLARRIVLAFPVEVPQEQYLSMIKEFCQEQFVAKGMIYRLTKNISKKHQVTYKGKELLPLSVIDAARDGDSQAVDQVLRYYEGYINKLRTRTLYDPDGQPHVRVDEYMKRRLEIKLIHSIVSMS